MSNHSTIEQIKTHPRTNSDLLAEHNARKAEDAGAWDAYTHEGVHAIAVKVVSETVEIPVTVVRSQELAPVN